MKISKIKVPIIHTAPKHLKEIDLTKKTLGSTVALVGKNGAGKSRILKFVETYINIVQADEILNEHFEDIPSIITEPFRTNIETAKRYSEQLKNRNYSNEQIKNIHTQISQQLVSLLQRFKQLGQAYIKVVDNDDLKNIKASINSSASLSFNDILKNSHFDALVANPALISQAQNTPQLKQNILLNEFTALNNKSTIQYLTDLSTEIITDEFNLYLKNRTNPDLISEEMKKKSSYQLFTKFQTYVKQFLGKEFSYQQSASGNTVNSTLYYNNEPFNLSVFSPGQKTLFAYAILFFYLDINSKANIRESIIIIDEPEKHLHPEAQITLINALKSIISKSGQLWIATHSVHILSHLEYDEILLVKDDMIIPPSRTTPGQSFNDLMGMDDHIAELIAFINSISEWAFGNFMLQCFKEPDVVFGNSLNDPQFKLFKKFLSEQPVVTLLDYGAGKGRIGYTLNEDPEMLNRINYSAFEPDKGNYELLNNVPNIKATYSSLSEISGNAFDAVLLCNVLHEINPKEWEATLLSIKEILKPGGYLLILEDRYLPKGEKAHEFGYLILGSNEMKKLLNSENSFELTLNENEYKDRIIFNAYKKEEINPNSKSVISAITALKDAAFSNIKTLKRMDKDLSHGRRYANETQLYINSQLTLEALV